MKVDCVSMKIYSVSMKVSNVSMKGYRAGFHAARPAVFQPAWFLRVKGERARGRQQVTSLLRETSGYEPWKEKTGYEPLEIDTSAPR